MLEEQEIKEIANYLQNHQSSSPTIKQEGYTIRLFVQRPLYYWDGQSVYMKASFEEGKVRLSEAGVLYEGLDALEEPMITQQQALEMMNLVGMSDTDAVPVNSSNEAIFEDARLRRWHPERIETFDKRMLPLNQTLPERAFELITDFAQDLVRLDAMAWYTIKKGGRTDGTF